MEISEELQEDINWYSNRISLFELEKSFRSPDSIEYRNLTKLINHFKYLRDKSGYKATNTGPYTSREHSIDEL